MIVFICLLSIVYQSHLTIGGGLGSGYYVFNLQKININNEAGAADICFNCKTNWIKTRKMTNSTSKWHRPKRFKLINRIFQKELYSSFYKWGVYKIRLSILCVRKKRYFFSWLNCALLTKWWIISEEYRAPQLV